MRTLPLSVVLLLTASGTAFALKPGTHASVTKASCRAAGLPTSFCTRIATEDYDTDSREWNNLEAHAQIAETETACVAADHAAARLWMLGDDLRHRLADVAVRPTDGNVGAAASALGRALHTIQDNCAHHGMPNPQHAWFSMSDFCDGTALSPDIQDDALTCARQETDKVMALVAARLGGSVARSLGSRACPSVLGVQTVCDRRFLPGPIDACEFFATAEVWDGNDRTWENAVVTPALREAFAAGLDARPTPTSICAGDESVLSRATSEPIVDVSGGTPSCLTLHLFCLGKADDGANPFADDPEPETGGGCSTGGGGAAIGLGLALAPLARRRRSAAKR